MLMVKRIYTSKETLKLLLNIGIVLFFRDIQLLPKQQLVNNFFNF